MNRTEKIIDDIVCTQKEYVEVLKKTWMNKKFLSQFSMNELKEILQDEELDLHMLKQGLEAMEDD